MIQGKDGEGVCLHWDNFNPKFRGVAGVLLAFVGLIVASALPSSSLFWVVPVVAGAVKAVLRWELTLWPERRSYRRFVGILGLARARTGSFDELAGWEIDREQKGGTSGPDNFLRLRWKRGGETFPLPSPGSLYDLSVEVKELASATGLPILEGPGIRELSATSLPHRVTSAP